MPLRTYLAAAAQKRLTHATAMLHATGATAEVARAFVTARKALAMVGEHEGARVAAERAHAVRTLL